MAVVVSAQTEDVDIVHVGRYGRRDVVERGQHWAMTWRRLLRSTTEEGMGPPGSFEEFDRTVRGMLNRISKRNACRLLPLDPSLRSSGPEDGSGDSPAWWASRFAGLMLASFLQVIHTNRCARGLAMRSADNVLPAYLDAVAPLLARSPRLVDALIAWLARLLRLQDLGWPVARLVHLAAREQRERATLPPQSLGRLPAELLKRRLLPLLLPPGLPPAACQLPRLGGEAPAALCGCWDSQEGQRDAAAVLAHLLQFAPGAAWLRLSAFAFSTAEAALAAAGRGDEERLYLGATILVAVAQRLEAVPLGLALRGGSAVGGEQFAGGPRALLADFAALQQMAALLKEHLSGRAKECGADLEASAFVRSRAEVAVERAERASGKLSRALRSLHAA